jgi:lysozyme
MTTMRTSAAGRKAIAAREGNKLVAYKDTVGVWTIGVGHTSAAGAPTVTPGMRITADESDEILVRDLTAVEKDVNSAVSVPLSQNQFDALVSFVFNIGGGAFRKSTLLRKLNAKDYAGAAEQFLVWVKQKELTGRRKAERAQFLTPDAA